MGVVWRAVRDAVDMRLFGSLCAVAMEAREACCPVAVAR
jgi:hypothetical protein